MLIRVILLLLLLAAFFSGCNGERVAELLTQLDGYLKAKQSEQQKDSAEPEPSSPTPEAAASATDPEAADGEPSEHDRADESATSSDAPQEPAEARKKPTPDSKQPLLVADGESTHSIQLVRRTKAFTVLMLLILLTAIGLVTWIWRTAFGVVRNRRTRLHQALRSLLGEPNLVNKVGSVALAATVLVVGATAWIVAGMD